MLADFVVCHKLGELGLLAMPHVKPAPLESESLLVWLGAAKLTPGRSSLHFTGWLRILDFQAG